MQATYSCDYCDEEYSSEKECIEHEIICKEYLDKITNNINFASKAICNNYGLDIKRIDIHYTLDNLDNKIMYISIDLILPNKNIISFNRHDFNKINLKNVEDIYTRLGQLIIRKETTSYEGILKIGSNRKPKIGDVDIEEIVLYLSGRKARLEIID